MGLENSYGMQPPMQPLPPKSQLDAQTERLAEQAEDIGWLKGQNDMLNEDNRRLEQEKASLVESNQRLQSAANEASADRVSHDSVTELLDELKEALTAGKVKK
jgi:hypothetical protein